jgi:hypothetical protein
MADTAHGGPGTHIHAHGGEHIRTAVGMLGEHRRQAACGLHVTPAQIIVDDAELGQRPPPPVALRRCAVYVAITSTEILYYFSLILVITQKYLYLCGDASHTTTIVLRAAHLRSA